MINSCSLKGFPVESGQLDSLAQPYAENLSSTHNVELPPINKCRENYVDDSNSKVESLLEQQIVLLKLILLFLGFLILSNVFKKN